MKRKKEYKKELKALQNQIGELQRKWHEMNLPVMIIFEGRDSRSRGIQIAQLVRSLDPRGFRVHMIQKERKEELLYPFLWRYWKTLPEKGSIAIYDGSWYQRRKGMKKQEYIESIRIFEKQLTDDGTIVIKFYLKTKEEKDVLQDINITKIPWHIIDANDWRYAALKIHKIILGQLKTGEKQYKKRLKELQKRLEVLRAEIYMKKLPIVIAFEGFDAAGKGGAIKRLTERLDPRGYIVNPTAAPNSLEKSHHYLWRFWCAAPKAGHIAIFDRTWYGRVLVERIEGFCTQDEWMRAYEEINEMEEEWRKAGVLVIKFWIQIDKEEQKRRFEERENNPNKRWKITPEDWRNREKWEEYESAVKEMLCKTSTESIPWILIDGNDKKYARLKILETVIDGIEKNLIEIKRK